MYCAPLRNALLLVLLSGAPAVSADQFTWRGQLEDAGTAATGSYDFQLQLFADAQGRQPLGAPLLVEDVQVTGGRFAVDIELPPSSIPYSAAWVEAGVRADGEAVFAALPGPAPVEAKGLACPLTWNLSGNSGTSAVDFLGTTDAKPLVLRVNNFRALTIAPTGGTPNIIAGYFANEAGAGTEGVTIAGGGSSGSTASAANRALADFATIGGGRGNMVTTGAEWGTIAGGRNNRASGTVDATVGGGASNVASGQTSTVAGGFDNVASAITTAVGGGISNTASGANATVAGGASNLASGGNAAVGGGESNAASGSSSTVAGGFNNTASGGSATVAGGSNNTAGGGWSGVAGGTGNLASGQRASVAGGTNNIASGSNSHVAGGQGNHAAADFAYVAGGEGNCAGSRWSWVGGRGAIAYPHSTSGISSDACHTLAAYNTEGAFIWADSRPLPFGPYGGQDSFSVRATGGVFLVSAIDAEGWATAGVQLSEGAGGWSSISDRNAKTDIEALDTEAVLDALLAMPVFKWRWKSEPAQNRHIGPMAQDFHAAYALNGDDDRHILTLDTSGVAMAAIQGLSQRVAREQQRLQDENAALRAELAKLRAVVSGQQVAQEHAVQELKVELARLRVQLAPSLVLGGK